MFSIRKMVMPNRKVLDAVAKHRRQSHRQALREYRRLKDQVPALIRQLAGPTVAAHDRAFRLLTGMGDTVMDELLAALADPTSDPIVAGEVVSLLGVTGDSRAIEPLWAFFQANQCDPERASTVALSLAGLGDDRTLPYLRESLRTGDRDSVSNAAAAMIMVGQMEDLPLLRTVHRQFKADTEIRAGVANAVLSILGEADQETLESELDDIENSLADHDLWDDIWALLEQSFGPGRYRRRRRHPRL
jgi:HEAT repeat protein